MSPAQAARQAAEEEPAANVNPEQARESETEARGRTHSELETTDLDDENDIGQKTVQILSRVRRRIREQPLTAAGGAFILGFAVGNGVPKFLARAGIAVGLRLVMQRMFDRELFEEDL